MAGVISEIYPGLYQCGRDAATDWSPLPGSTAPVQLPPQVLIATEGNLDDNVNQAAYQTLYIYWPIDDTDQVQFDVERARAIAKLCAHLLRSGQQVVVRCGAGYNRSSLITGRTLIELGLSPQEAVETVRQKRPGSLGNQFFANWLLAGG